MKKITTTILLGFLLLTAKASTITVDLSLARGGNDSLIISIKQFSVPLYSYYNVIHDQFQNGHFKYQWDAGPYPYYLHLIFGQDERRFDFTLLEPGDSIHIDILQTGYKVSGRGAEKWLCAQELDNLFKSKQLPKKLAQGSGPDDSIDWNNILHDQAEILQKWRLLLNDLSYNILSADEFAKRVLPRLPTLNRVLHSDSLKNCEWVSRELSEIENGINSILTSFNDSLLSLGYFFPNLIYDKIHFDSFMSKRRAIDIDIFYHAINSQYKGFIANVELFRLLVRQRKKDRFLSLAKATIPTLTDPRQKDILNRIIEAEEPGTEIREALFTDQNNQKVSLARFRDTVLLLDLWFTGCKPCQDMQAPLKKVVESLEGRPFKVISISIDTDMEGWKNSVRGGKYTNKNHVNLRTGNIGREHPFIKYYQINSYPTLILVNKKGRIASTSLPDPRLGDIGAVLNRIEPLLN
jgi:thiol-disulfide isomerase/thioredoxin